MWATSPQLVSQPAVELHPPDGQRPALFGYASSGLPGGTSFWDQREFGYVLTDGQSLQGDAYKVFHLATFFNTTGEVALEVRLSEHHFLRVKSVLVEGVNGEYSVRGGATARPRYFVDIELENTQANSIQTANFNNYASSSGLIGSVALGCGYCLTTEGWVLYGFASLGQLRFDTFGAPVYRPAGTTSAEFGQSTACLRTPTTESDVLAGNAVTVSFSGNGSCTLSKLAGRLDPFLIAEPLRPDTLASRKLFVSQYEGWLRSKAALFFRPVQYSSERTGSAGQRDVTILGLWAPNVPNQPISDLAFIRPNVAWSSNLFPDHESNERLARIRLTVLPETQIPDGPFYLQNINQTLTVDCSTGLANNEYTGSTSSPFSVLVTPAFQQPYLVDFSALRAYVGISLTETAMTPVGVQDDTLATVGVKAFLYVAMFFVRTDGSVQHNAFITELSQNELDTLASGGAVSKFFFYDRSPGTISVSVQGIGPA